MQIDWQLGFLLSSIRHHTTTWCTVAAIWTNAVEGQNDGRLRRGTLSGAIWQIQTEIEWRIRKLIVVSVFQQSDYCIAYCIYGFFISHGTTHQKSNDVYTEVHSLSRFSIVCLSGNSPYPSALGSIWLIMNSYLLNVPQSFPATRHYTTISNHYLTSSHHNFAYDGQ